MARRVTFANTGADNCALVRDDARAMRREDCCNIGAGSVDLLDQVRDLRCHDQQVSRWGATSVPVCVRRSSSSKHGTARVRFDYVLSQLEPKCPVEHVPRLVVLVVNMKRRDPMVTDLSRPLHDHEAVAG